MLDDEEAIWRELEETYFRRVVLEESEITTPNGTDFIKYLIEESYVSFGDFLTKVS